MANESTGRNAGGQFPETESLVPGSRERIGSVGRNHLLQLVSPAAAVLDRLGKSYAVRYNVRVAVETSFRVTVILLVTSEVPDDEGFVAAAREKHVWATDWSELGFNVDRRDSPTSPA